MLLDMVTLLLVGLPRSDQVRGRPSVPEVPNVSSRNCTKKIFPSLIFARSENGEVISMPDLRPRYVNEPNIATLSPCSSTITNLEGLGLPRTSHSFECANDRFVPRVRPGPRQLALEL